MLGRAFLCAIAGLIGWLITEPLLPKEFASSEWQRAEFRMVFIAVLFIGLAAGFHQGYMKGGKRNIFLGLALGLVFGTLGGLLGYQFGGTISTVIFGDGWALKSFPIIPRAITFAFIGSFLGAGIGVTQFRARIIMAGAFGGLIGGGIAGLFFDPLGMAIGQVLSPGGESGFAGRALMWPLMGFTVGLFTAWLEQATRQAWVRLIVGRNEGKEWPIDGVQTHLGRDERANVPLFGDNNVAPLHATITRQGVNYILSDAGTPIGTGYQGVRLAAPVALQPGDMFQVGNHQLQFLVKASAARRIQEGRAQAIPMGHGQQPAQPLQPIQTSGALSMGATGATSAPQTNPTQAYNPQTMNATSGTSAPQTYALIALDGPMTGQRIPINAQLEAGRETPGINLGYDAQASRRHATLSPTPSGVYVKDLGSTNGTYLNGQRIPEANAPIGSVIKIGSTSFRVESA
ncbi:MAG: FHA domain-containing protein [Fimbriimonadaceae bacterium]